ncbi:MAG: dethiobiotin synthase [Cyclobacteriaceae bacterium]
MKKYFVTGIDTDSGKTLVSAILCEMLQADYWKPIQAGYPTDRETVMSLVSNTKSKFHKELFLLTEPMSPHAAAKIDGVSITMDRLQCPDSANALVIEGAGGCLVPINNTDFVIDIALKLQAEVVLVADLYLGSINHTLLTVNLLRTKNARVKGIIFNGEANPESQEIILHHSRLPQLLHINKEKSITPDLVSRYAGILKKSWHD